VDCNSSAVPSRANLSETVDSHAFTTFAAFETCMREESSGADGASACRLGSNEEEVYSPSRFATCCSDEASHWP